MTHAAPPGWRLVVRDMLGSTQQEAIAEADAGGTGPLAILAHLQTAGRGSRGRQWTGATGNLHLSVLLDGNRALPEGSSGPEPGMWSLLAGIVLHEVVAERLRLPARLSLKWPNDLLFDGAKLGGVLIDSTVSANGNLKWVAIGFGLNVSHAPALEGRRTASLAGLVDDHPIEEWACSLLTCLDRWRAVTGAGLRDAWLARAHPIGTWLEIATGAQRRAGTFDGIAADGSLLLADQAMPVSSGEIFAVGGPK